VRGRPWSPILDLVLELIAFKQLEGVVDLGHRSVEQRTVGQGDRAPAFGDYLMAPFFCSSLEPVAELRQGLEARVLLVGQSDSSKQRRAAARARSASASEAAAAMPGHLFGRRVNDVVGLSTFRAH
jgi:hypothetical protein